MAARWMPLHDCPGGCGRKIAAVAKRCHVCAAAWNADRAGTADVLREIRLERRAAAEAAFDARD